MNIIKTSNQLLSRLTHVQAKAMLPHLSVVSFESGTVLSEPGSTVDNIWFPESCLITKVAMTEDGRGVEIGMIGREGMTGVCQFLGGDSTPFRAIVQIGGSVHCISTSAFQKLLLKDSLLQQIVSRYTLGFLRMISQSAACNQLHSLTQRIARWLLLASDGVASLEIPLTHESLALLLGVRRQSVTEVAREFAQGDLIRYRWGQISILDRRGLEATTCDCYRLIREFRSVHSSQG